MDNLGNLLDLFRLDTLWRSEWPERQGLEQEPLVHTKQPGQLAQSIPKLWPTIGCHNLDILGTRMQNLVVQPGIEELRTQQQWRRKSRSKTEKRANQSVSIVKSNNAVFLIELSLFVHISNNTTFNWKCDNFNEHHFSILMSFINSWIDEISKATTLKVLNVYFIHNLPNWIQFSSIFQFFFYRSYVTESLPKQ